jgi:hypothetical protein
VVKVRKEKYFEEERKRLREEKAKGKSFFLISFSIKSWNLLTILVNYTDPTSRLRPLKSLPTLGFCDPSLSCIVVSVFGAT